MVSGIFERLTTVGEKMSRLRDWFGHEEFQDKGSKEGKHSLKRAMHEFKAELFSRMPLSAAQQKQVAEIIGRAIEEVRAALKK
jgi:hypothetical protein